MVFGRADSIIEYLIGPLYQVKDDSQDEKHALRALPANWYTSSELYELERRAIFSKKWQLVTHKCRFNESGDWLKVNVAGFEFVITRDRDGNINAFHNVCRHRAYPVVEGSKGKSSIFTCKYHGWSYAMNGKLTKAPGYQELDDFDKSKNGLLSIHNHIDANGFIYINMDAKETPELSWEEQFNGIDRQPRYSQFNFDDYVFDHFWEMEGDYNWKILADNYNECYHCASTHPDIGVLADLQSYSVSTENGQIVHNAATTDEQRANGLTVASTYYFPNVSTNVSPHFFMIQRFVPISPSRSAMQYQVFRNKHSPDSAFDLVNNIYKRIMSEDKALCHAAQQNLNAGIFTNGELHPRLEKGPLHFQDTVRKTVMEHWKREQKAKKQIWPARPQLPQTTNAKVSSADIDFCNSLAGSCPGMNEKLEW